MRTSILFAAVLLLATAARPQTTTKAGKLGAQSPEQSLTSLPGQQPSVLVFSYAVGVNCTTYDYVIATRSLTTWDITLDSTERWDYDGELISEVDRTFKYGTMPQTSKHLTVRNIWNFPAGVQNNHHTVHWQGKIDHQVSRGPDGEVLSDTTDYIFKLDERNVGDYYEWDYYNPPSTIDRRERHVEYDIPTKLDLTGIAAEQKISYWSDPNLVWLVYRNFNNYTALSPAEYSHTDLPPTTGTRSAMQQVQNWNAQNPFPQEPPWDDAQPATATLMTQADPDRVSFQKVAYKLVKTPDTPAAVIWAEVFTPVDSGEPTFILRSWTPAAEETESPVYTIDPLSGDAAGLKGTWSVEILSPRIAFDSDGDNAINYREGDSATLLLGANQNDDDPDPRAPEPDWSNDHVDGPIDLKDFVPVFLDLKQMVESLPPGDGVTYKLKHEDGAINFVYTNLTRADAYGYLSAPTAGFGPGLDQPAAAAPTIPITSSGVDLFAGPAGSPAFLNAIQNASGGVILLEARRFSMKPLVLSIERSGQVLAQVEVPLVLARVEIAVDANRDGTVRLMPEDSSDQTAPTTPYRFWLNDDDDDIVDSSITGVYSEVEDDDRNITNVQKEDWRNNVLDTPRDLEDFARLWVNTQGLNDSFKNGQLYLGLKWKNTTGTPAIKLYRSKDATGSADYLFNTSAASQQALAAAIIDARYPDYVMDGNFQSDHTLIEGSEVFIIPTVQFSALSESNSRTAFLFEGCKAGTGQLALIILKKEGTNYTEIGEGPGVWLDLKEPKDFIERWSAGNDALGEVQPVVRENSKSASPAWGNPTTEEEKDYVLYVHGYNMQEFEKQRWIETTFKRLYWLGYKGRVGGFTWPCSQSAPPYDASEERAWESAVQLKTLLSGLKTAGYRVHVMAHSQGNVVAGEALRQWAAENHKKADGSPDPLVRTYIASQAAIQAHCYDMAAPLIPGFAGSLSDDGTPNVYVNYPPTGAPYMGAAAMSGAATNWLNFENPGDYALTGNSLDPLDFHPGWQVNQRLKPDAGTGMGYNAVDGFFTSTPTGIRSLVIPGERFKIFSYLAEGRSLALGSTTTGGVFVGNNTNLAVTLSYGLHHRFHSGQFRSFMSERYEYWRRLMLGIGLQPFTP